MIDLYYWTTPNGHKITLFLEETGMDFTLHPINIGRGNQFTDEFLKIAPNNKIPAIVDHSPPDGGEPLSVFESGAILIYLSDKTGKFNYSDLRGRTRVLDGLMLQLGGLGPMAGQNHHFAVYAQEKFPYAIERYINETARLYAVVDKQLQRSEFITGEDYTIADMASYPWVNSHKRQSQDLNDFPNLKRWYESIKVRPATVRAYDLVEKVNPGNVTVDEKGKSFLFGQDASTVRN